MTISTPALSVDINVIK